jgi:protein gp37
MGARFPSMASKYSGPLRLNDKEFGVRYGTGRTIFIDHLNDLFAAVVPSEWIRRVLAHCNDWPDNTYVFQTKNPARFAEFIDVFPRIIMLGTTIETDRHVPSVMNDSPPPRERYEAMRAQWMRGYKRFITAEPLMEFTDGPGGLADWMIDIKPDFVNIGADSKGSDLIEPTADSVRGLINALKAANIEVKRKTNLDRILS